MNARALGFAGLLSLLLATSSSAGIVLTTMPQPPVLAKAELITTTFGYPDKLLDGFVAYQLSIEAPGTSKVAAVDFSIRGSLHQRWADTDLDGEIDPTLIGMASDGRADSHLTPPSSAHILLHHATEDNNVGPSPLADGEFDYGIGSVLKGVWGIPGSYQTALAELAYIVIPQDFDPSLLDIELAVSYRTEDYQFLLANLTAADFFPPQSGVPEPGSLVLAVTASLALSWRKGVRGLPGRDFSGEGARFPLF
jgi:hypothetical protein